MKKNQKKNELFSETIDIKGAKVHNLKNISLNITRENFTVVTGLSGSGKSSLAFDTLYAEGQRRYVESLSSYARQFLGRINKPEVEYIKGIPPAIAVEQKVNTRNPRSTVGTSTEIYDYIKLLYARAGDTFSPVSGKIVKRHSVTDAVNFLISFPEKTKALILAPFILHHGRESRLQLEILQQQGYSRMEQSGKIVKIQELLDKKRVPKKLNIVIDRISVETDEDTLSRAGDSVQTAFYEGDGDCFIKVFDESGIKTEKFSNRFEADGIKFEEPSTHTFSFNSPLGACPTCEGFGKTMGIDQDLVFPDKSRSIYQEAAACWRGEKMSWYKDQFILATAKFDFPVHKPYFELSQKHKDILWYGNKHTPGIYAFFKDLETQTRKIQFRVMLSRYRGKTVCPDCKGTRLKKEASYIKIANTAVHELVDLSIKELIPFFKDLKLSESQFEISKRILTEIRNRLQYLADVGLDYLTLNRLSATLSGGESQRINLAGSLGSSLVGSLYILDEPSIGLHSRDTERLIGVLRNLRDIGNSVIVVEHDEDIILAADELIDIGPLAGTGGGNVVFQGNPKELKENAKESESLTAKYITGLKEVKVPEFRRKYTHSIKVIGANENNLKNIDAEFPLNVLTAVTGVSGSGKSSLVKGILYPAMNRLINDYGTKAGSYSRLEGDMSKVEVIEFVDQNPIGKSSRSNPITYLKGFDEIRKLYATQQAAKINGFTAGHFSFNVEGGRCEECQGEGEVKVEMQFMADVHLECEHCKGKRYKDDVLDVLYRGKSIFDILELTVSEALEFFNETKTTQKIASRIQPLFDTGLGYVKLGQSSNTLSGGESQRIKLASFLSKENEKRHTLFIFDEPTTGLHFHDINKLMKSFYALLDRGHTVVVVEHNLDVVKCADHIIDIGPEGGNEGGNLVYQGSPEGLLKCKESYTAGYLKAKLKV